jgi:hypothetical protein
MLSARVLVAGIHFMNTPSNSTRRSAVAGMVARNKKIRHMQQNSASN